MPITVPNRSFVSKKSIPIADGNGGESPSFSSPWILYGLKIFTTLSAHATDCGDDLLEWIDHRRISIYEPSSGLSNLVFYTRLKNDQSGLLFFFAPYFQSAIGVFIRGDDGNFFSLYGFYLIMHRKSIWMMGEKPPRTERVQRAMRKDYSGVRAFSCLQ